MTAPVRIALIGCGRIAQIAHLPALEKADGVELVAVCDPAAEIVEAVARRYGVGTDLVAHQDPQKVWDDPSIEAVIVAAPDRFHHTLAADALRAGKHVLVEKPLCSTVAQARELVGLVEDTGLVLQVGAMKRHDAGMQFAHRFVAEQLDGVRTFTAWYRIGDLRAGIEATLFPRVYSDSTVRQTEAGFKADRPRYLLATHGAHIFDTVRYLAGEVASVVARHRDDGKDQAWQIILTTVDGAVGTVSLTVDVPGQPAEGIEVFGARGSVRVDTHFPFYRRASTVHAYSGGATTVPELVDGDAYERQLEAFAATVRSGGRPVPDVRDGLAAVALIEAVAEAVETGREIRC